MSRVIDDVREFRTVAGLAAVAGFVDGVGFVALGGFFLSFITGNSTRSAVMLVGGDLGAVAVGLSIVATFVVGVIVGGVVGAVADRRRRSAVLATVAVLLALAGVVHLLVHATLPSALVLTAGMGALNAAFARRGGAVAVTYMTGMLVTAGLRVADRILGRGTATWLQPFGLWTALTLGAVAGAAAYRLLGFSAPAIALAVVVLAAGVAYRAGQ